MAERQRVAWYWPNQKASPQTVRRQNESIRQFRAAAYNVERRDGCAVIRPATWQRADCQRPPKRDHSTAQDLSLEL